MAETKAMISGVLVREIIGEYRDAKRAREERGKIYLELLGYVSHASRRGSLSLMLCDLLPGNVLVFRLACSLA